MRLSERTGLEEAGVQSLMAKLKKLSEAVRAPIQKAIVTSAMLIANDARASMPQSRGGATRTIYRDGTQVTHTASAEGEPPAVDTGELVSNVIFDVDEDGMGADVGTNVLHGAYMEFGTPTIAPRPWLFPAFERNKRGHIRRTKKAVDEVLKESGK